MARDTLSLTSFLSLGAVLLAVAAFLLEPFQEFITQTTAQYEELLPFDVSFAPPTVIDTIRDIRYIGSRSSSGVEHFQNIFYAEDTSGKNRFAPPVPTVPPKGSVIDATRAGAWCPQGTGDVLPFTSRVVNISENCLSLRIARPQGTQPDEKLPVVVWLHGGGHALGSASDVLYEPDGLVTQAVKDNQPLIWVAINYRLGIFGFATSQTLRHNNNANVGLRDQRAAFEWVRDNIEAFGGDPSRVTAMGQSVGASDIGLQLIAFGGRKGAPFQKAIMMSGAPGLNFNIDSSGFVEERTAAITRELDCMEDEEDDGQSEASLRCLREAPLDVLTNLSVTAARKARPPFGEGYFYPTHDDCFLLDKPSHLIRAGMMKKGVPLMASWVANDGAWYAPPTTSTDQDVLASFGLWITGLREATKEKLLDLYPLRDFEHMVRPREDGPNVTPQYYRAAQMNRDLWFTCPVLDFSFHYGRWNNGMPVRLYEHNATRFAPAFKAMGVTMWRIAHLSDIPYVLNAQRLGGGVDNSAAQRALAKTISRSIVKFITSDLSDEEWPVAFSGPIEREDNDHFPTRLSLRMFGGPYGQEVVSLGKDESDANYSEAEKAVAWEKLFERCKFINDRHVRNEIGV